MCSAQTLTTPPSLCCLLLESLPASPSLSDSLGSASSPATLRPQQAPSPAQLAWLSPPGAAASLPAAIPHPCAGRHGWPAALLHRPHEFAIFFTLSDVASWAGKPGLRWFALTW